MIKRIIYNDIKNHLSAPEMTVLIGPRQVGKTYLMKLLQDQLAKRQEKTIFLNLDIEDNKQFFVSQTALIDYIRLQAGDTRAFVFVYEIQRKKTKKPVFLLPEDGYNRSERFGTQKIVYYPQCQG